MGNVSEIYLLGDYAKGIDSNQIDILVTGKKLNLDYISNLEKKLSTLLKKKVVIIGSSGSELKVEKLLVFSD